MPRRMWPVYAAGIAEHFGEHLTEDEARAIAAVLGRFADAAWPCWSGFVVFSGPCSGGDRGHIV
jgi:hypothetical protein